MKIKKSSFSENFNIFFLPIFSFLFLGISYTLHAETLKFSTTWGVAVYSDDGIHYTGTYGKGGKFTGTTKLILELSLVFSTNLNRKKMYF